MTIGQSGWFIKHSRGLTFWPLNNKVRYDGNCRGEWIL
jgi:hypothetical protein